MASHSHTLELPTSHMPPHIFSKTQVDTTAGQVTSGVVDTLSPFQYLDQALTNIPPSNTLPAQATSTTESSRDRDHRSAVLSDIDFVQTLSSKLAPAIPTMPRGPSEIEKKLQAEIQRISEIIKQKERDEEIAAAVSKGKAEGKAEAAKKGKEPEPQKNLEQKPFCNDGSCGSCPNGNRLSGPDCRNGLVFHLHTHQNSIPVENNDSHRGAFGHVEALKPELYERRRSSVGDAAIGYARRAMDNIRRIEARTAMLEEEMESHWKRDAERQRKRYWDREIERERHLGPAWARGYF